MVEKKCCDICGEPFNDKSCPVYFDKTIDINIGVVIVYYNKKAKKLTYDTLPKERKDVCFDCPMKIIGKLATENMVDKL
jgi:hypothetical protein